MAVCTRTKRRTQLKLKHFQLNMHMTFSNRRILKKNPINESNAAMNEWLAAKQQQTQNTFQCILHIPHEC